ncbi:serine/threonine-protein kinase [Actinoalloteichus hymeniacidonis]|uniref:Protein kinase family protein n=1 Tax=Actinoalloteichus hymeniacidonis TaxID=340345 RepID=A0AAC9HTU3_9PSEU|nr:serine/threonine-protein kinase [Actinoalloteichus hymeniacidonis]AOS65333.1 protein kinase family protein [Actinoalloteichus hymeniacidonis]MBB5906581.1 serine/threonine protein kinase [Actinoalloteichus hymeniacidonis]
MESLAADDPRTIERYRLFGRLGAGGMGRVFLALSSDGRTVALKLIHQQLTTDPLFRSRFRQEVEAARLVSGAYTAPVMDADAEATVPWLATVYVPGPSLRHAVAEDGPLPVSTVRTLAAGLAAALREVHRVNLIHRDLTPANVLLTEDGPRVIDFGITRAADSTGGLTATGMLVGSPGFLSPEQVEGHELTPASDVFALGATLCFAASGTGPFGTASSAALLYRVVHSEPELDTLEPEVRAIVEPCLAKDPTERPSPDDLLRQIGAVDTGDTWLPQSIVELIDSQRDQVRTLRAGAELIAGTPGQGSAAPTPGDADATDAVPESVQPEVDEMDAPTTRSRPSGGAKPFSHTLVSSLEPSVSRSIAEHPVRAGNGGQPPAHTRLQPHPADANSQSGYHQVPQPTHATNTAAAGPATATQATPPPPRSRRGRVAALGITVVVVIAIVVLAFNLIPRGGLPVSGTGSPETGADDVRNDPPPVGEVAGAFVDEWAGLIESPEDESETVYVNIRITGGNLGASVGTVTGTVTGCSAALILDDASDTRLQFHERDLETGNEDADCPDESENATLDLLGDGTLRYTSDDPERSGTFSEALAELPAELEGEWSGSVLPAGEDEDEDAEPVEVELALDGGATGEEIGVFTRPLGGCSAVLTLRSATPGEANIVETDQGIVNEGYECVEPASTVLRLTEDGGLHYRSYEPSREGVLELD